MSMELVETVLESNVATIRLNSEQNRNAMTKELSAALHGALVRARHDPQVRAIIVTGTGTSFCAGGDLKRFSGGWTADSAHALLRDGMLWMKEMVDTPKPVIAAVNGNAIGAGFSLALAADVIIASESAEFCAAFTRVGLTGDCASGYFLVRAVGLGRAKELLFSARTINAREAVGLGFVLDAVPGNELTARARSLAEAWASGPTIALGLTKELLNRSSSLSLYDYLSLEAKAQAICFNTMDHTEGVSAMIEKRQPSFRGK